jgi:tol-pal system protein YbgF
MSAHRPQLRFTAFRTLGAQLALAALVCGAMPAQAALFGDDEARQAIIDLRGRVNANKEATDAALRQLDADWRKALDQRLEDASGPARRGLLDLVGQIDSLKAELATLRGQNEQLAREVAELQRRQKDVLVALEDRLRALEPISVTVDGQTFQTQAAEKTAFEAALAVLRESQFARAAELFDRFAKRYPDSGYTPLALYWEGNALYATRDYKPAIDAYQALLAQAPKHPKAPEALLAIANCQIELKDSKAAKRTLETLVKAHPSTEAGATAKDRLARLK